MTDKTVTPIVQKLSAAENSNLSFQIESVPEGYDAYILGYCAKSFTQDILYILREDVRMAATEDALQFFHPDIEVVSFPAWDCLPYDRVSPNPEIVAHRMTSLGRLCTPSDKPRIVLTTVNAFMQRIPAREMVQSARFTAKKGDHIDLKKLTDFLIANGFSRIGTVMEPSEFASRGGIIDIFPPNSS